MFWLGKLVDSDREKWRKSLLEECRTTLVYVVCKLSNEPDFLFTKVFIFSNINVIPFKIVPLGSYAPIETLFPLLLAALEVFNWYGLQRVRYTLLDVLYSPEMTSFEDIFKFRKMEDLASVKKQTALILSSIWSFELSLVEESSQCVSPHFASWSRDLAHGDSVKKIKTLVFSIVADMLKNIPVLGFHRCY